MNKEEIELVCEAIDFYNLNHFKGEKTKKQLVSVKKRLQDINFTGSSLELNNTFKVHDKVKFAGFNCKIIFIDIAKHFVDVEKIGTNYIYTKVPFSDLTKIV